MSGHELKSPFLRHGGQAKNAFHSGKRFPKTRAAAGGKWEIRKSRTGRSRLRRPSRRLECLGIREPPRVALRDILRNNDDRAGLNRAITDLAFLHRAAPNRP